MRFSAILAAAFAAVAAAQGGNPNPFTIESGFTASAGETVDLTWDPTTDGTVTLTLRSGSSSDLDAGTEIESGLDNSGSYSWQVPEDVVRGTSYTIEISSDEDPEATNYSAYFTIESDNVSAPSDSASASESGYPTASETESETSAPTGYSNSTVTKTASETATATLTTTTTEEEEPTTTEDSAEETDSAPSEPTGAAALNGQGAPMLALAIAGAVIAL